MQEIKDELVKRKRYLEKLIECKRKNIMESNSSGSVHAISHRKQFQYYLKDESGTSYIKAADRAIAQKIVQNEYDNKVLAVAEKEYKKLEALIKIYDGKIAEDVYENMPYGKQLLVKPIEMTDDEYLDWWEKQKYQGLEFRENSAEYYSLKGERMRSKSEVIIANLLDKLNVKYKYEKELVLDKFGIVHPDFTILDIKKRREIYWEHLGMMDDQVYRNNAINKIRAYERDGYFMGDRLIVTAETLSCPLDVKVVERKIRLLIGR